jgi:hypothetical protein
MQDWRGPYPNMRFAGLFGMALDNLVFLISKSVCNAQRSGADTW